MSPTRRKVTYRVRQIPSHCNQFHEVARVLSYVLNYQNTIHIHSLASSIDCFDRPPTKVATVTFADQPVALADQDRVEWIFPRSQTSLSHNIIIDIHFRGFTVLNEVDDEKHLLSCIAVTGLGGHAFGSWASRDNQSTFMWLRDAVPQYFSHMRVLSYGYDSQLLGSESFQTIQNISLAFISKLRSIGLAEHSAKPILLIGHSLGGIVVKEAIVQMANSPALEEFFLPKIVKTVLFGVPNRGMRISHLLPMVKHRPNERLIQSLRENSPYLADLDEQFYGVSLVTGIEIISVYETHKSQTPKEELDGSWTPRAGPHEILVEPHSAIQRGTAEIDQYPVNRDHSGLVKFTENDDVLGPILHFMRPSRKIQRPFDATDGRAGPASSSLNTDDKGLAGVSMLERDQPPPGSPETHKATVDTQQRREMLKFVLQNIGFEETESRYRAVESAYCSTFDWVFETDKVGLVEWIKCGTGIFWINGKPGSGKSTVMKHIYQNYDKLSEKISNVESDWKDITARFFFSQRGSAIQKSLEGLLRSVLHQILSDTKDIAHVLVPALFGEKPSKSQTWSLSQLDTAWEQMLAQRTVKLRITLVLDALDEFDGPPEKVARFVERTASQPSTSWTHVRICFASRPWDAFNDRFSRCHGFQMEQHTKGDIERFVNGSMYGHEAMKLLLNSSEETERSMAGRLISRVLEHARGVFIWVKLVLENILEARTEGAELEELDDIIAQLPSELEDLYEALLVRVKSQAYHREAYAMLELLVRLPRAPTLHEFRCLVKCATLTDLDECVESLCRTSPSMSPADIDTFRRRIRSRCGGLLEIIASSAKPNGFNTGYVVQFMHQTVKDFVARPGFKNLFNLANNNMISENGHSFIAKCALAMIKGVRVGPEGSGNRIWWVYTEYRDHWFSLCANAFRNAEATTGFSQQHLLDRISDQQFAAFFPQERYDNDLQAMMDYRPREWPVDSRMSFAIMFGLQIYCENSIQRMKKPISSRGVPILHLITEKIHHAMQSMLSEEYYDLTEYTRLLLSHGVDVGQKYEGLTPFQALFRCTDPSTPSTGDITEPMGRMAEVLLEYGSDPNTDLFYMFDNIESFALEPILYVSKPLHIAICCHPLLRLFLDHGANVNGLDGAGQTALDKIAYCAARSWEDTELDNPYIWASAAILVRRGGRATRASLDLEFCPESYPYDSLYPDSDSEDDDFEEQMVWRSRLDCLMLVSFDDEVQVYCEDSQTSSHAIILSVDMRPLAIEYPNLLLPYRGY